MNDKNGRGISRFALPVFFIFMLVMFWLANTMGQRESELSRKEFEQLVEIASVKKVTVIQNRDIPTGRIEIEMNVAGGKQSSKKQMYVSDVNEIQF